MKKFLSAAVDFGLVAEAAATASTWEFAMDGKYQVDGYWIDAASSTGVDPIDKYMGVDLPDEDADWYQHTFRLNPTLTVNDKVRVNMDIRLIDSNTVWGGGRDLDTDNGGNVDVNKVWLVYDSPIGKWEIGRRPGGAWGLDFVSSSTNADRIFWHAPTSGPFKAYAFLQKSSEIDYDMAGDSDGPLVSGFNGQDSDYYEVGGGYKTDEMTGYLGLGTSQQDAIDNNMWRVKGWGQMSVAGMGFMGEFDYKFGDKGDFDYDSWALMLGMTMKLANIDMMFGYAGITGDNNPTDDEINAYDAIHGTGDDFEPLYILTGNRTNVLNGDRGADPVGTAVRTAGVHALVATADFAVSEDLTLHGGLGWGMAQDEPSGWDDAYGWEADLGMAYKLYQNLTYELHFGYWFVGDFAEMGGAAETDDVMLLSHHLTMKF